MRKVKEQEKTARNRDKRPSRIGRANKKCIKLQTHVDIHSQTRKLNSDHY